MVLIRVIKNFRIAHRGPEPNGTFWALKGFNDIEAPWERMIEARINRLLQYGRLWMQDAEKNDGWIEIRHEDELPSFKVHYYDDYDGCTTRMSVIPFMPEFYFVPFLPYQEWADRTFLRNTLS